MCNLHQERYIILLTTKKCYVSAHFRCLLTTFVLIRNILLAFTTSCMSIFDISNDILYTSSFFIFLSLTIPLPPQPRIMQISDLSKSYTYPCILYGKSFRMSKYNTDCFLHNVLLDSLNLQRQLCISQPFGNCFLYSKKSPLFTFLWSVLEQDRRFELPPSVWKTDVLTVNTNLAYKGGEPSSPRAIFNVVFLTRWFHHKLSACFYGGFYASHTRWTT